MRRGWGPPGRNDRYYVRWGKGEAAQAVWTSGRVLAECLEALVGAVYLDDGMSAAAGVLRRLGLTETA